MMSAGVALNLLALGGVLLYVLRHVYPLSEAVRLRNALLLEPSGPDDFDWTPDAAPHDFRLERRPPSAPFIEAVRALGVERPDGDWPKALALAGHLTERAKGSGPIRSDLLTTYRLIREGGGYCADFVKVYLALAHAAGLLARQWAFSFDGFGGHGHTFAEVFDRQRGKWLFVDVHNNFHAERASTGEPLSAFEFRALLLAGSDDLRLAPNGPGRPGFVHVHKALDYYRRGLAEWYLWWGNAVFSDDANPLGRWAARLSGGLGRLASILLGTQPRIRVLHTDDNAAQIESLATLRRHARLAIVLLVALVGLLVAQLWRAEAPV
jgi:hypothetical protein